jgi:hypothetical protein
MSANRSKKPHHKPNQNLVRKRAEIIFDDQLLYSRNQVCRMLGGVHPATVVRLEEAGKLHPVKLNPGKLGRVYYRRAEVVALAEG